MDIPVKKLVKLMASEEPGVRSAAVLVAAELGIKDQELNAEVIARIADSDSQVRLQAIRAAGNLKIAKSLNALLDRIRGGGDESNLACVAAAKLGSEGIKGLQGAMAQVAPGLRRYIAAALTGAAGAGAAEAGVAVLTDKDPQVAAAAANAIINRVRETPADRKAELVAELVSVLGDRKNKLPLAAELPVVRVLVALNDPTSADTMWDLTIPPHTHEVRALALQTVGGWLQTPTKEQWRRLFLCAVETDFRVAAPALLILSRLPVNEKQLPDWQALFDAPDVAARRVAVEKLGDRDTPEVAAGLMAQLRHADQGVRDASRSRLAKLEHGRKALVSALLEVEVLDELWQLSRLVAPFSKEFPAKSRKDILDRACKHLEADDHRCDPLYFLLREGDATALREEMLERAVSRRKKKDYETAMKYLKLLARDPSVGFAVRLELAMVGLKLSPKEIATDFRSADPCLRQFANVLGTDAAEVQKQIEKAKWLEPEDLFYLGFHFAELFNHERAFGAAVLQHLVKVSPRSKLAANAKTKLKTVVLK
jgi:HEAT repeat protein